MEQGLLPPKGAKQNGGTEGLCFFSLNGAEDEGKGAKRRSHTDCTGPISGMRSSVYSSKFKVAAPLLEEFDSS